jgi:hypothetical protein
MVEQVLHLDIIRRLTAASELDMIDGMAAALKFSRRESQNWINRTLGFISSMRGAKGMSYAQHAMAETDFRNRRARHIVYGHTHQAEIVPLDASHADGYVLSQTYFNAGTCRKAYQPTQMMAGNHELVGCDGFTLLCFYQDDERSGRTHETWCGTLALAAMDMPEDTGTTKAATPPIGIRAPRFAGSRHAMSRE